MMRLFPAVISLSVFLVSVASADNHHDQKHTPYVTLYEHENFGGVAVKLPPGEYFRLPDFMDSEASSIRIPRGCRVTVYSKRKFRGRRATWSWDFRSRGRLDLARQMRRYWDDEIRSLRFYCGAREGFPEPVAPGFYPEGRDRMPSGPEGWGRDRSWAALYDREYFSGPSHEFSVGRFPVLPGQIDQKASSIWIHPLCRVTVFSNPHFRGRKAIWTSESVNLDRLRKNRENYRRSWNDQIRSIQIECDRTYRNRSIPEYVSALYDAENFEGKAHLLRPGKYPVLPSWIDRDARSVWIHPLCKATVYSNTHFRGRRVTWSAVSGNLDRLRKNREKYRKSWDKKIRSLMVECDYSAGRERTGESRPQARRLR